MPETASPCFTILRVAPGYLNIGRVVTATPRSKRHAEEITGRRTNARYHDDPSTINRVYFSLRRRQERRVQEWAGRLRLGSRILRCRETLLSSGCNVAGMDTSIDLEVYIQPSKAQPIVGRERGTGDRARRRDAPVPVMNEESSLARKSAALACSIASPNRPIGMCTMRRSFFSGVSRKFMRSSVCKGPLRRGSG